MYCLISFIVSFLVFLQANAEPGTIWTQQSFTEFCVSSNGKIVKKVESEQVHLECRQRNKEVSSAWFSIKQSVMIGWLERMRNSEKALIKDQEFDGKGVVKEIIYYLRSTDFGDVEVKNMFVFDANNTLLRGNIALGKDSYVIANPGHLFHNGNLITEDSLKAKLTEFYKTKSSGSFYDLIHKIWNTQNGSVSLDVQKRPSPALR